MLDFLSAITSFIFSQFDSIWILYTGGGVFTFTLVLWILDRLFHIFDIMKR